ncbi:hypothetical protein BH10PLA2_BH10PLA2_20170 [soil metagenome]
MVRKFLFVVGATLLVSLTQSPKVQAWGGYHYGYTHVGYGGVQHYSASGYRGGYGDYRGGAHYSSYGGYHTGYGSAGYHYGSSSYHYGYGGAAYGDAYRGGVYRRY